MKTLYIKLLFLTIFVGICNLNLNCQAKNSLTIDNDSTIIKIRSGNDDGYTGEIPNVIYPSPEVMAMTRYGDYPVGHNTGIVDITIPLYEIQIGNYKLPINIKFHPSGRKAGEKDGILGYGWTLDAGGIVSRVRRGLNDEAPFPSLPADSIMEDCHEFCRERYTYNLSMGISDYNRCGLRGNLKVFDGQYDIFTYVLPSGSGKFILKDTIINGLQTKIPFTIPYRSLNVNFIMEYVEKNNSSKKPTISIVDIDGTQYFFGASIDKKNYYTEYYSPPQSTTSVCDINGEYFKRSYISAWNLTGIVSSNKKDTIYFEYGQPQNYSNEGDEEKLNFRNAGFTINDKIIHNSSSVLFNKSFENLFYEPKQLYQNYDTGGNTYSSCRIKKISHKNCSVVFDIDNEYKLLKGISVYNTNGETIKKIVFDYSKWYDTSENCVSSPSFVNHYLENIKISASKEKDTQGYKFDYYDRIANYSYRAADWWGYYNGVNNLQFPPGFTIQKIEGNITKWFKLENSNQAEGVMKVGDRDIKFDAQLKGMIKSITYPTGGKTEFQYEPNKYRYTGWHYDYKTIGNRIYEGRHVDSVFIGPGLRIKAIHNYPVFKTTSPEKIESKYYEYGDGHLLPELHPNPDNYAIESIARLYASQFTNNNGTTDISLVHLDFRTRVYNSDFTVEQTGLTPTNIFYEKVSEHTGSYKTEYEYSKPFTGVKYYDYYVKDRSNPYYINNKLKWLSDEYCWRGSKLIKKTEYISGYLPGKPSLRKSRETNYYYKNFIKERREELTAHKAFQFIDNTTYSKHESEVRRREDAEDMDSNEMGMGFVRIFCHAKKKYTSGAELLEYTSENLYDDSENIISSMYKYYEYEQKNLLLRQSSISQHTDENNSYNSYEIRTNYQYPFDKKVSPYTDMVSRNILTPVVEQTQYRDDSSIQNVFLQKKITEYKNWGNNLFAPEFIKIQTQGQSSPETRITYHNYDKYGNPVYLSKDGAINIVYIWGYGGQYPIAEIKNATRQQVISALNGTTPENLSSALVPDVAKIEGLRTSSHLSNAQITTYYYRPLIGITEVIDPRGVKSTFKYDGFNRLETIKDNQGKVKEMYDYRLSNQN